MKSLFSDPVPHDLDRSVGERLTRLRPLVAALALACASGTAHAASAMRPGEVPPDGSVTREDGTPLRVALRAWHEDAKRNESPPSPHATVRPVTNCDDDGPGSLRAVVAGSAGGDIVDLTALTCGVISLETGGIGAHVDGLSIIGPGADRLTIDGNHLDRVLLHYGGQGFLLRGLTIANGYRHATGFNLGIGGCIASAGYLTLDHSVVSGCYVAGEGGYGGAIYAYSLIMMSSTLSGNIAYGVHPNAGTAAFGGAAFVYQVDLVNSTVSGNFATHRDNPPLTSYDIGGGIVTIRGGYVINSTIDSNYATGRGGGLATFGSIKVSNSTISGNGAGTFGAGGLFIRWPANLDMRNSTVTANRAPDGGGVLLGSPNATIMSSIIAGNEARYVADLSSGARQIAINGTDNLIGSNSAIIAMPLGTLRGDPRLRPLAYNGGPTRTHALRDDSPVIDAGDNPAELSSDQRGDGYPRVVGTAADIGAFEYDARAVSGTALPVPSSSGWMTSLLLSLTAMLGLFALRRHRRDAQVPSA